MDFGHIPYDALGAVDFSLPATSMFPSIGNNSVAAKKIYLGSTRWVQPEWIGNLYPSNAKPPDFLNHYTKQFSCIELNATHYKLYDREVTQKWAAEALDFKFCPKLYQGITHRGTLYGKEAMTASFVAGISGLQPALGPVFIQLPESFGPGRQVELLEYLSSLPTGFQWMVELRHPLWFSKENTRHHLFSTLKTLGIGAVITDTAGRRDVCHMQLTARVSFIRFVGNQLHPTDYSRMDAWAERIASWFSNGLEELYFILHMGDDKPVPFFAQYAAEVLTAKTGIAVKTPELFKAPPSQGTLF